MKSLAYVIIALGAWQMACAVDSQRRGVARAMVPGTRSGSMETVKRADDPRAFRNLMFYQWFEAGGTTLVGVFMLVLVRRQDTLDPFSDRFAGSAAVDDLERTLNKEEEEREERRRR